MLSQQHWNGNQMVAMKFWTTGPDPEIHRIWHVTMVPLYGNLNQRRDVFPLDFGISTAGEPADIDWRDIHQFPRSYRYAIVNGLNTEFALEILDRWIKKLKLQVNKGGFHNCKIIPLCYDFGHTYSFLSRWLHPDYYNLYFKNEHRDILSIATFINDRYSVREDRVPFSKSDLRWLAKKCNRPRELGRSPLTDVLDVATVYRELVWGQFPAILPSAAQEVPSDEVPTSAHSESADDDQETEEPTAFLLPDCNQ